MSARERRDRVVALGLTGLFAAVYSATALPEWHFDSLRFAVYLRDGDSADLVRVLHVLGNLASLGLSGLVHAAGFEANALLLLGVVNVGAASAAVGLTYLTARRIGADPAASLTAAGVFGASLGAWRSASQLTVYGVALGAIALSWLLAVGYIRTPSWTRAAWTGAALGLAVGAHLGALTMAAAFALVLARAPGGQGRERLRHVAACGAAAVSTLTVVFLLGAGAATGWTGRAMWSWLTGPQVDVADESRYVGFGFRGLVPALFGGHRVPAAFAALLAAGLAAIGAARLVRDRGPRGAAGIGLAAHSAFALVAAGWFLSTNPDHFSLALVPMALLWATAVPRMRTRAAPALAVAMIAAVLVWNDATGVRAVQRRTRDVRSAAAEIGATLPAGAHLLTDAGLAPRAAWAHAGSETGWSALRRAVRAGAERPGLTAVVQHSGELWVTSGAFNLTPAQARFLGADAASLWPALYRCCVVRAVAAIRRNGRTDTLYVVRRR
jgi:hypothetical protein